MKTSPRLFTTMAICFFALMTQQSLAEKQTPSPASKKIVQVEEKKAVGSAIENPIILKGIKTYAKVKEKQQDYIRKQYEGYKLLIDQFFLENNQQFIQGFVLKNDKGEYAEIYFDITDICKSSKKLNDKELSKRIQIAKDAVKYSKKSKK